MGNKQAHDLSPDEKQRLKQEKEKEKALAKLEKERIKREKKEEKERTKKNKKKSGRSDATVVGDEASDAVSEAGSAWSERSVGSAPASWYHSASEPSSKRSSVYMNAPSGKYPQQHDCWRPGYEDSSSDKSTSKPPSRASSSARDTSNLRAGSLERYPLGVPSAESIEPMHRGASLDFSSIAANKFMKQREEAVADDTSAIIASRYDENLRASRDKLTGSNRKLMSNVPLFVEQISAEATVPKVVELTLRGEKRKAATDDQESLRSSLYYSADEGSSTGGENKRRSVEGSSVAGSIYYSADEGGSMGGSIYYSATSGSEVEERARAVEDDELMGAGIIINFLILVDDCGNYCIVSDETTKLKFSEKMMNFNNYLNIQIQVTNHSLK